MAAQHGQVLYLSGSKGPQGSPSGSLSNRFQKLSQSRGSGITVLNQPSIDDRASSGGRGGHGSTRGGGLVRGGLHTPGGLARAMQERGGGVSDEFLLSPSVGSAGGPTRRKKGVLTGASSFTPVGARQNNNGHINNNINTRASRHKSMVIGSRPGRAAAAASAQDSSQQRKLQQQQPSQRGGKVAGRGGRGGRGGLAGATHGKQPVVESGKKAKGKGKAKAVKKVDAQSLDSELSSYMMANSSTAASLLDQDLDTYMADMPIDGTF